MELKKLVQILRRRWAYLAIPFIVVVALGVATYEPAATSYNVGVRYMVGQEPSEGTIKSDEERLYNWTASEYIVNGLNDWVRSLNFAGLVSEELASQGIVLDAGAIRGAIAADHARSMLTLSLSSGDATMAEAMINAATVVLVEKNSNAIPQLGSIPATVVPLDEPVVNQNSPGLSDRLQLPVRIVLALIVGAAAAIIAEYLDPTLKDSEYLDSIGVTTLGSIPRD